MNRREEIRKRGQRDSIAKNGLVLFALLLPLDLLADETQKYRSFDGKLEALVIPVGGAAVERRESRVEIRDSGGNVLLSRSFALQEGKNGFIVYRVAWTPDSQFLSSRCIVPAGMSSGNFRPIFTVVRIAG